MLHVSTEVFDYLEIKIRFSGTRAEVPSLNPSPKKILARCTILLEICKPDIRISWISASIINGFQEIIDQISIEYVRFWQNIQKYQLDIPIKILSRY